MLLMMHIYKLLLLSETLVISNSDNGFYVQRIGNRTINIVKTEKEFHSSQKWKEITHWILIYVIRKSKPVYIGHIQFKLSVTLKQLIIQLCTSLNSNILLIKIAEISNTINASQQHNIQTDFRIVCVTSLRINCASSCKIVLTCTGLKSTGKFERHKCYKVNAKRFHHVIRQVQTHCILQL